MFKPIKFLGIAALIIATVVMFSSCNKYEKKIVGKWKIVKEKVDGEEVGEDEGETITFRGNGTCTIVVTGIELDGDYYLNGETLTINAILEDDDKYTFTLDVDIKKSAMYLSGKYKNTYIASFSNGSPITETDIIKVSYELTKMK